MLEIGIGSRNYVGNQILNPDHSKTFTIKDVAFCIDRITAKYFLPRSLGLPLCLV